MHMKSITVLWPVNLGFTAINPTVVGSFDVSGVFIVFSSQTAGVCIDLYGVQAGSTFTNLFLQNGLICFRLNGSTANPINELQISNFIFDSYGQTGFSINLANPAASSDRVSLKNGIVASASAANVGIALNTTTNGNIANCAISNVEILYNSTCGVQAGGTKNLSLRNLNIRSGNAQGSGIDFTAPGSNMTMITGCALGLDANGLPNTGSVAQRAVLIEGQTHSNIFIDGCVLAGSVARISNGSTDPSTIYVTANNQNADIPNIPSAAAIPIPAVSIFEVSGAAPVTSVTGLDASHVGRSGLFIAINPAPGTWTAGPTIGNTFTPLPNVPVAWFWDGTRFYGNP